METASGKVPLAAPWRPTPSSLAMSTELDFDTIYETWFDDVVRWLGAMGAAESDLEDLAQEVFMVVRSKLPETEVQHARAWLYGIALRLTRNHRRQAWFRHLFLRPREVDLERVLDPAASPVEALEHRERRQALSMLLDKMSDKRRRAFVLYELEGYSGEEIAALEAVPVATVWTRLHHARKDILGSAKHLRERNEAS